MGDFDINYMPAVIFLYASFLKEIAILGQPPMRMRNGVQVRMSGNPKFPDQGRKNVPKRFQFTAMHDFRDSKIKKYADADKTRKI